MEPGAVLADKYRLERVLGEGATGQVWRAIQLDLDRPVALKLLHPALASHPDGRLRFLREARVTASLHHPGAVRILDVGDAASAGGMYLVMELLVGETLRARMDRGPLPRALALDVIEQIALVLEAAHRINLVHRDIKPENTFLLPAPPTAPAAARDVPTVKLVDFGLAFIADAQTSLGRLTADGVLGGTPAYMSPEQARGRAVGPASDIYSLGCVLYELFAGRPPFVGSVTETITRHAYAPPVPLRDLELEPPAPAAVDELLRTMLSKSPPLRPTARQVVDAIAALVAPGGEGAAERPSAAVLRLTPRGERQSVPAVPAAPAVPAPGAIVMIDDPDDDTPVLVLAVEGALDDELRLALAAARIEVAAGDDRRARAIFAPGASLDRLRALAARGLPLYTDVDAGDFAGIAARVRAGCRAAVTRPVSPAALVARIQRVPSAAATLLPVGAATTGAPSVARP